MEILDPEQIVLTREEVIKLINAAENPKHKILIELLYSTGMRLSEALNLKYSDIDFNNCEGWIRKGKGSKDRLFFIGAELQNNLLKYREGHGGEYIFHVKGRQMSARCTQHIIKISAKRAGINKSVHVHTLRHTFVTHLYEDGVDVLKIQALLGRI